MATLNYYINPKQKKRDGTMNVKIILTHQRKRKMISTSIYATSADLTKSGKLKKGSTTLFNVENLISEYRKKINGMGIDIDMMTIGAICSSLKNEVTLDFFEFADRVVKEKRSGTQKCYATMLNAVEEMLKVRSLNMKEITVGFFHQFETFLRRKGCKDITIRNYIASLRSVYASAQKELNNEFGDTLSSYPLKNYSIPKPQQPEERALDIEDIRNIYRLDISDNILRSARDWFILSFAFLGMNPVDMYNATYDGKGVIRYCRTKTKTRRADKAYIEVFVDDRIKPILDRYSGNGKLIDISRKLSFVGFQRRIAVGMRKIGAMIGKRMVFYSARHSFASIAYNNCGVDKYSIHAALNHVDRDMKITDIYIKRDFSRENEVGKKVLDLLFSDL